MRRSIRWLAVSALVFAAMALAVVLFHGAALRAVGQWLVAVDPPAPVDAIVVLAGGTPVREVEAAKLFERGLAPRVVLSRAAMSTTHLRLLRLGIRPHDYQTEARMVLERRGVPTAAIVALREVVLITETELRLVHQTAVAYGYRRVILVTSLDHTRRVRLIWSRLPGRRVEALLHAGANEGFSPDSWWRYRRTFELVLHEYLGILAITLGVSHLLE